MSVQKSRAWFRFENKADDPTVATIHIQDVIGSWDDDWIARNWGYDMGVTARQFVEQLAALDSAVTAIHVHINSPGGDVQAGVNIANALREQQVSKGRSVETFVDGIAASIASVIAMAGSKVHVADNALVMVHNPYSIALGNASDMRKTADVLDAIRGQIVNTYKWHSSLSSEDLIALMDAETWMDADQAIANGFATDKVEGLKAAASIDARVMATLKVPEQFKARVAAFMQVPETPAPKPQPAAATDVLRLCKEGGCLDLAEALLTDGATLEQVQARVASTKNARAAATARATEITALCQTAKLPALAAGYIAGAMSLADVRTHLTTITALLDHVEIDGTLKPEGGPESIDASWKSAYTRAQRRLGAGTRH